MRVLRRFAALRIVMKCPKNQHLSYFVAVSVRSAIAVDLAGPGGYA